MTPTWNRPNRGRTAVTLAVIAVSLAPVLGAARAIDARNVIARELRVTKATPAGKTVRLANVAFDPGRHVPRPPRGLGADMRSNRHWLVQMRGPVSRSARDDLEAVGANLLGYLPDFTYVVSADSSVVSAVKRQKAVRWVGPYHPWYKLSQTLKHLHFSAAAVPWTVTIRLPTSTTSTPTAMKSLRCRRCKPT